MLIELSYADFQKIEDSKEQRKAFKKITDQNSDRVIGEEWGLSMGAVRKMRHEMGIKKRAGNGRPKGTKQSVPRDVPSDFSSEYYVKIEGRLSTTSLTEKLENIRAFLDAVPGEQFDVKVQLVQASSQ